MSENDAILKVNGLKTYFYQASGVSKAVDGVSFSLRQGTTMGIVGESGSGKTTIGRAITRINPTSAGEIYFKGKKINGKISKELDREVIKSCQMIFQDPMTSLNPIITVGDQIMEVIRLHDRHMNKLEAYKKACEMLELVGIKGERAKDYPHQFSGGMKQRVIIAMALACNPKLLIADEPTTALDVTIQAQVLELMRKLKEQY